MRTDLGHQAPDKIMDTAGGKTEQGKGEGSLVREGYLVREGCLVLRNTAVDFKQRDKASLVLA